MTEELQRGASISLEKAYKLKREREREREKYKMRDK